MLRRIGLPVLFVLLSTVVLAGCTMVDLLVWSTLGTTVVLDASEITPLPADQTTPASTPTACPLAAGLPLYIVVSGDTLAGIAQRAGSTAAELARLNCLSDANRIIVGQSLRVPHPLPAPPTPTQAAIETSTAVPPGPRVVRFIADPQTVGAGGMLTLAWEIQGAESALLRLLYPGGVIVEYGEVPVTGTVTVDIPSDATGTLTAQLIPAPLPERGAFGELVIAIAEGSAQEVVINRFVTSSAEARPGETITLSWSVSGAPSVSLVAVMPDGALFPLSADLPPDGSQSFTFADGATGLYSFQLWPLPGTLARVMSEVSVSVSE